MSSINGMPVFNSQVYAPNGTSVKKSNMTKWIIAIVIILCILYFFRSSSVNKRLPGESCRYNTDCRNKYCKCRNGGTACMRNNRVCL